MQERIYFEMGSCDFGSEKILWVLGGAEVFLEEERRRERGGGEWVEKGREWTELHRFL